MTASRFSRGILVAALLVSLPLGSAWAAHRSDAEAAIAAAKAAQQQAAAAGVKTDETAALIKEAEALLTSRQYTKAMELADKAKKQDDYAASQAGTGKAADTAGGKAAAPADSAKKAEAEQAIADAEAARKKAASVKGEWRDTGKMIKEAGELVKSGDFDEAIKKANKAKRQGELGYQQALSQKGANFPSYALQKK